MMTKAETSVPNNESWISDPTAERRSDSAEHALRLRLDLDKQSGRAVH
jgi:hypothetical protein